MVDDIQVTPSMIKAGLDSSAALAHDYRGEEKVVRIYRAMEAARKPACLTVEWRDPES